MTDVIARHAIALLHALHHAHPGPHHPPRIRDGPAAHTLFPAGIPQIILTRASLRRAYWRGFEEYPSVAHLLPAPRPRGLLGVGCLCLHEFAHVLQHRAGQFDPRRPHNRAFAQHYARLLAAQRGNLGRSHGTTGQSNTLPRDFAHAPTLHPQQPPAR